MYGYGAYKKLARVAAAALPLVSGRATLAQEHQEHDGQQCIAGKELGRVSTYADEFKQVLIARLTLLDLLYLFLENWSLYCTPL